MNDTLTLNNIKVGDRAYVRDITADESMKNRFEDLGLISGTLVRCELISPLGDPVAYNIRGAVIAIRREDAEGISVVLSPDNEACREENVLASKREAQRANQKVSKWG